MEKDLISIVIPAYNVEKYILKCVNSCLTQTYKNIEVIVIDDGSTDSTLEILNKIKNKKLQIIHKENDGVSSSRNIGIKNSNGKYITFVDGDDYLSEDFIEYMHYLISKNNSEFAFSSKCYVSNNLNQDKPIEKIINSSEAACLLLSQEIIVGSWNKIYSLDFLKKNKLYFNEQQFYGEGLEFILRVALKATNIAMGNRKVYFYRRNNPISATTKFKIKNYINGEESLLLIKKHIPNTNKDIINAWNYHYCLYCLNATSAILLDKKSLYKKWYNKWRKQMIKYYFKIILIKEVNPKTKAKIFIAYFLPKYIAKRQRKKQIIDFKTSV